jgi:hypothetical protein
METEALEGAKESRKVTFHRVAENLYRLEQSGEYYGLLKRGGKQFRKSLKTKDRKLAERHLADLRVPKWVSSTTFRLEWPNGFPLSRSDACEFEASL